MKIKLKAMFYSNLRSQILILFLACIVKDCLGQLLWTSTPSKLDESLCTLCGTTSTQFMKEYCHSGKFHSYGRCCLNSSNNTLGIDLGNCNITMLPKLNAVKDVSWINLALNPQLNCNNFTSIFEGFQHLQMMVLPRECHTCPGGNILWEHREETKTKTWNCSGQLDNCDALNRTCPKHSTCVSNGPGFYECLCDDGYGEYRCLVMNGMPLVIMLCAIAGATVVIIIPIWFLIRRRKNISRSGYVVIE